MPLTAEQRQIRARLGAASRYDPGARRNAELRREFAASCRESRITELLREQPPLPADRLARIASTLTSLALSVDTTGDAVA